LSNAKVLGSWLLAGCESYGENFKYGCMVSDVVPPSTIFVNAAGQVYIPSGTLANLIIDLNQERKRQFMGLVSGAFYWFYFFVGNAAGVSTLSVAKGIRCGLEAGIVRAGIASFGSVTCDFPFLAINEKWGSRVGGVNTEGFWLFFVNPLS